MFIEGAKRLQILPGALSNWNGSEIFITDVEECIVSESAIPSSAKFFSSEYPNSLYLHRITTLYIAKNAIGTDIDRITIRKIRNLTVETGAFMVMKNLNIEDVGESTIHSGAFAAETDVNVLECGCVAANNKWRKFIVEDSVFNHIETPVIQGVIDQFLIKHSTLGTTLSIDMHSRDQFRIKHSTLGTTHFSIDMHSRCTNTTLGSYCIPTTTDLPTTTTETTTTTTTDSGGNTGVTVRVLAGVVFTIISAVVLLFMYRTIQVHGTPSPPDVVELDRLV